ncbi:MAG: DUF2318 domain-containing protein [Clostridia bacterium]|nr:DUF2318 domain-containing protein [Clostridia bacterium]
MSKFKKFFIAILAVAISVTVFVAGCSGSSGGSTTVSKNGKIQITVDDITSTANYYDADVDGVTVEVFAVRASDDTVRVAFNTCQVCYGSKKAYFVQSGKYFICQNCKNKFATDSIGKSASGCNPVPITSSNYTLSDGVITISKSYISANAYRFTTWKNN